MRPRDYLKVLSALKQNQKINVEQIARDTEFSQAEVKRALKYLCQSAVIIDKGQRIQFNVCRLGELN